MEREDGLFDRGVELFNEGKYFECHEVLEELWNRQAEPQRQFTQGLIQIAVATHHLLRENYPGAIKLYDRGLKRLEPFKPGYCGIDVVALISASEELRAVALDERQPPPSMVPRVTRIGD